MKTIKRLTEDDIRVIVAGYFGVDKDKVSMADCYYEECICDVEVDGD